LALRVKRISSAVLVKPMALAAGAEARGAQHLHDR
jgi:hypothetical protein